MTTTFVKTPDLIATGGRRHFCQWCRDHPADASPANKSAVTDCLIYDDPSKRPASLVAISPDSMVHLHELVILADPSMLTIRAAIRRWWNAYWGRD